LPGKIASSFWGSPLCCTRDLLDLVHRAVTGRCCLIVRGLSALWPFNPSGRQKKECAINGNERFADARAIRAILLIHVGELFDFKTARSMVSQDLALLLIVFGCLACRRGRAAPAPPQRQPGVQPLCILSSPRTRKGVAQRSYPSFSSPRNRGAGQGWIHRNSDPQALELVTRGRRLHREIGYETRSLTDRAR